MDQDQHITTKQQLELEVVNKKKTIKKKSVYFLTMKTVLQSESKKKKVKNLN